MNGSSYAKALLVAAVAGATALAVAPAADATVLATIPIPRGPVAIDEVDAGGAVRSLTVDGEGGHLYRIDPASNTITQEVDLPPGTPTAVAVNGGGLVAAAGSLWVPQAFRNEVLRIDPVTGRILRRIPTGGEEPDQIAAGGGSVWVNQNESGSVARIDPGSNSVVATIPVGRQDGSGRDQPVSVSFDPAGNRVLVSLPFTDRVATIDAASQRVHYLSVAPAFACGRTLPVPGGFWLDDTPCSFNLFRWDNAAGAITATTSPDAPLNRNLGGVADGTALYTAESFCGPIACSHGTIVKRDLVTGAVLSTRASHLGYTALPAIAAGDVWCSDFGGHGGVLARVAHF